MGTESLRTAGFLCCGFGVLSHPVDDHGLCYAVGGDSHDLELYIVFTRSIGNQLYRHFCAGLDRPVHRPQDRGQEAILFQGYPVSTGRPDLASGIPIQTLRLGLLTRSRLFDAACQLVLHPSRSRSSRTTSVPLQFGKRQSTGSPNHRRPQ